MDDLKLVKALVRNAVDDKFIDFGKRWGFQLQVSKKAFHDFSCPFNLNIYTCGSISNPAFEPVFFSKVEDKRSETDPLDNPVDMDAGADGCIY